MSADVATSRQSSAITTATTTDKVATKTRQSAAWTTFRWPIGLCEIGESAATTTTAMATTKALQSKRVDDIACRQQRDEDDHNNNNRSSKNKNRSKDINIPSAQRIASQKRRPTQQQLGQHCDIRKRRQQQQQPLQKHWWYNLVQQLPCGASKDDDTQSWSTHLPTFLKQQQQRQQQQWLRFCLVLVICLSLPSATNTKPQTSATAATTTTIVTEPPTLSDTLTTTPTIEIVIATSKLTACTSQTVQSPPPPSSATESADNIVTNELTDITHTTTTNAIENVIIPSTKSSVNSTTASKALAQTLTALTVGALTVSTALPAAAQTFTSSSLSSAAATTQQSYDTTTATLFDSAVNALAEAKRSGGENLRTQTAWNAHFVNELLLHGAAATITQASNESPAARYHSSNNNVIRNAPSGSNTLHVIQQLSPTNANTNSNNYNYASEDSDLGRVRHQRAVRSVSHGSPGSVGLSSSSFGGVSQAGGGSGLGISGNSGVVGLSNAHDGESNNHNSIECPSFDENSACPCYKFEDGLFLECPGTTAMSLRSTLERISSPIHSLSIYDFDRSVTSLSQDVFQPGVNIRHLQFSHSHLETLKDNSLRHVRATLESLSIVNGKLTQFLALLC